MYKIANIFAGIMAAFLLWLCFSWADVVTDNLKPAPEHSNINFFVVISTLWEEKQ